MGSARAECLPEPEQIKLLKIVTFESEHKIILDSALICYLRSNNISGCYKKESVDPVSTFYEAQLYDHAK